jgi:hypothetical protein
MGDSNRRSKRTEILSIQFDGEYSVGWKFRVHTAFRPAFDISLSTLIDQSHPQAGGGKRYRQIWTQGNPPAYDFHEGDTLHSMDDLRLAQVIGRSGNQLTVRLLIRLAHGLRWEPEGGLVECSQNQFVEFLKTGIDLSVAPPIREVACR